MTPSLSVLIPARNEMFLQPTVDDILAQAQGDTEVIVVLDGAWPVIPLNDHPRLRLIHHSVSVGQRAAVNEAASLSRAEYVMKLDAHCTVGRGFDLHLIEAAKELGKDTTQVPVQYNLHAFDWMCDKCGNRTYQGPTPTRCADEKCPSTSFHREMVWRRRRNRRTTAWRFDSDLHFQYWSEREKTVEGRKEFSETLSLLGACFFLSRERYWELGGMDEEHGSWGQMGTEVACKSWLSGGRVVCNKRTWFSHLFRTQGGDFGFPYPNPPKEVEKARARSRELWIEGKWPGQVRTLPWLISRFSPVPGWERKETGKEVMPIGTVEGDTQHSVASVTAPVPSVSGAGEPGPGPSPSSSSSSSSSIGIIYYSDCVGDEDILQACRRQLVKASSPIPIVSCTLAPIPLGRNLYLPAERGIPTMFRQILTALENSASDIVFFCEHDCLYHPSHFTFLPPRSDTFYYNENQWKVDIADGKALFYHCRQTSGLVAYRSLLLSHYRKRVERVEREGYDRRMGYEPGTHRTPRGVDDNPAESWMSSFPNIDIRHNHNLTRNRWSQDQFRDKRTCQGWRMEEEVPGWGRTKGRMREMLREI